MLYRLSPEWPASAAQWEAAIANEPFAECSATQQKSTGWVPPRGQDHGALVEAAFAAFASASCCTDWLAFS